MVYEQRLQNTLKCIYTGGGILSLIVAQYRNAFQFCIKETNYLLGCNMKVIQIKIETNNIFTFICN